MPRTRVLVEVAQKQEEAFARFEAELASPATALRHSESVVDGLVGLGVDVATDMPPVPMLSTRKETVATLEAFASEESSPDVAASSIVVAAEVDASQIQTLQEQSGVRVWSDSPIELVGACAGCSSHGESETESHVAGLFDRASSAGGTDCRPFRSGVSVDDIRTLLGVQRVWLDGFRGQNVVVGIVDEGVNGLEYPVVGGFSRPNAQLPGTAPITSHGSMCAADVLVAAPAAKLYDYPFLGIQNSGGALPPVDSR
ncbi:MAG TPA: hypothetical protein VIW24_02640 [Aldersonia sp.]